MEISSSLFSVVAKQSLKFAESTGLDSLFTSDDLGMADKVNDEAANILPTTKPTGKSAKGGAVSDASGKSGTNPNNPSANAPSPEMVITGGYPSWMNKPLIGLAGLLDICSPAGTNDIQGKNTKDGKVEDPYCCDCGEGGMPVVGGGYILMKTLDKVRELQKGRLKSLVSQYKSGKLNDGQALLGITSVLNTSLHSSNGDLIPTALELPIGQESVKLTLNDAVNRSDMDWIKTASDGLGTGVVGPILSENMGTLTGGLLTRGDLNGVNTLNEIKPDWSDDVSLGSLFSSKSKLNTTGLTDKQAKDVLVAASVKDKVEVRA